MKILAICGSPHRGNTYSALNSIKEDYPDIDYKIVMLNEVDLKPCLGCYACVRLGEEKCPLKDDRDMIIQEMHDADGVLFASPVYVNFISALMKTYIERTAFFSHRPRFFDKYGMVMAVCGMFGAKEANDYMRGIFTTFGFNMVSSLELAISTKSEEEKKSNHEKTMEAFNTFIAKIKTGERNKPATRQIINFHIFKSVSEIYPEHLWPIMSITRI